MKRALVVLASVLVAVGLAEVVLRWREDLWKNAVRFDPPFQWLEYDPLLGWRNQPGYRDAQIEINNLAFRGANITRRKPDGTVRIACLGDSRTFGVWQDGRGARFDNAYPPILQSLFATDGRSNVEVLNAGVIGYTSAQGLRQLKMRVLGLAPDVVIVSFGFNDHSMAWNAALRSLEPESAWGQQLLYAFGDVRLVQLGLRLHQGAASRHPPPFSVPWVEPDTYRRNLQRFAEVARQSGIRLVFLLQPLRPIELGDSVPVLGLPPQRDPYALFGAHSLSDLHRLDGLYQQILRDVAVTTATPLADAAATLTAHAAASPFSRHDLVHVNPEGAHLIAQTVYATLRGTDAL